VVQILRVINMSAMKAQSITPTTPANFYDCNEEIISIPLISLTTLVSGLRLSDKFNEDYKGCVGAARHLLSTPKGYKIKDILHHLETALADTKAYYGIE